MSLNFACYQLLGLVLVFTGHGFEYFISCIISKDLSSEDINSTVPLCLLQCGGSFLCLRDFVFGLRQFVRSPHLFVRHSIIHL